jgi:putative DNA-invertase from lambdoid prophage Rac
MFRAGLYARVSTQDQQTLPLQMRAMRDHAAKRGWTIALEIKEVGSGAAQREQREKLLDVARRREIESCWYGGSTDGVARWPIWS